MSDEILVLEYLDIRGETDQAILFEFEEGIEVWLPKSQIEVDADESTIEIPEWLALDKEIEQYEV